MQVKSRKLMSVLASATMIISMGAMAFANSTAPQPTGTVEVSAPAGVNSVTIDGVTAKFYQDVYNGVTDTNKTYIRATVGANHDAVEGLRDAEVVVDYASQDDTTATYDLYDKAQTITIGGQQYTLAASVADGTWTVDATDAGGLTVTLGENDTATTLTAAAENNVYAGNPYYSTWSGVTYKIQAAGNVRAASASAVYADITPVTGTNITGGTAVTEYEDELDLTGAPTLTVGWTENGAAQSRTYTIIANVNAAGSSAITFGFSTDYITNHASDYDSYGASMTYTDVLAKVTELQTEAASYFASNPAQANETVMAALQRFLAAENITYSGSSNYISSMNGVGEFDAGSMSGWMYTVDGEFPNVGAGEFVLSEGDDVLWVYVVDYSDVWSF